MAKVKLVSSDAGNLHGYSLVCPGCRCRHVIPVVGDVSWGFNGNCDSPTFTPSLKVNGYNSVVGDDGHFIGDFVGVCHSIITDGRIQFCGDCTHVLAGQTVDLPDQGAA